jgi:hypothetical protein
VKDENGDLLADSHNILNRLKNCCSQLLNVHRQIKVHTPEPMVADSCAFKVEIAVANFKLYKSPGSDQILAETLVSEIHKFINSIWNKNELPHKWKEFIIVPIYKKGNSTDCNTYRGVSF